MRQVFDDKLRLSKANKARLEMVNSILEEYKADGYVLTLRQLYYQLVSKDVIPNQAVEYTRLSNVLKKGRMAGIVDWDAIEDRVRKPKLPYWVYDQEDAVQDMIKQYRLDRMKGQDQKIEVWIEKDALSGILSRVTNKYHCRMMVNRGYSSLSAMYDAYGRLNSGDTILYFGDHDPSGLDMIRDIRERLYSFNGLDIEVVPVALNMDQIRMYDPPPNPTKVQDPRAGWYIEQWGHTSWELDALQPQVLIDLAEGEILKRIDLDLWKSQVAQEKRDIRELKDKFGI